MGSYGRNIEFRKPPRVEHRDGRYCTQALIPIGVPVKQDLVAGLNEIGLQKVALATTAQAPTASGCGLALFEYAPAAFAGDDPNLVLYSDKDTIPSGAAIQLVHGVGVKVVLTNTDNAGYAGFSGVSWQSGPRVMVAGLGATPTVVVGDYLSPGVGNDTDGYWAESNAANGWLRVTAVDLTRHEVEAEFTF